MTTPDMSAPATSDANHCGLCNLVSILGQTANQRHAKAVGQMLANGDCAGAEKYALQKGDLDLVDRVDAYCAHHHFLTLDPSKEAHVPERPDSDTIFGLTPNPHR
jgi:hypothetical protein